MSSFKRKPKKDSLFELINKYGLTPKACVEFFYRIKWPVGFIVKNVMVRSIITSKTEMCSSVLILTISITYLPVRFFRIINYHFLN